MKDKLTVTVPIADRSIKMTVADNEEGFVRDAAKIINERIDFYRKQPGLKDNQEVFSRVALDCMVARLKGDAALTEWQALFIKKAEDLRQGLNMSNS